MARLFVPASSQRVDISGIPDYTSTVSYGAWIWLTAAPSGTFFSILMKGASGSGSARNFGLEYHEFFGTRIAITWSQAAALANYSWNVTLNNGQWYHLLAVIDWTTNPDTVALYVDGTARTLGQSGGTNNEGPALSGTQVTKIAATHAPGDYFNGRIAEAFVTSTLLSANHAKALSAGLLPNQLGVTVDGYWPLWGNESPEQDLSGNGRTGTLTNTPTRANHAPVMPASLRYWRAIDTDVVTPGGGAITGSGGVAIGVPSLASVASEAFLASGATTIAAPALAASGAEIFTGTGAFTIATPALAASGLETFTGTGTLAIAAPALSGTGLEAFTGTGTFTIRVPALSGTGVEVFTGTASLTIAAPTLAASGSTGGISGSGSITIAASAFAGAGLETFAGTGVLTIAAPALGASGIESFAGTGALTIGPPSLAGSASGVVSGSGALTITVPALAAAALETFIGTGALSIGPPVLNAAGTTGGTSGSAAVTIQKPALTAAGVIVPFVGNGVLTIARPALSGAAFEQFTGAGAVTISTPSLSGLAVLRFIGTGSIVIGRPSIEGVEYPPVPVIVPPIGAASVSGIRTVVTNTGRRQATVNNGRRFAEVP